MDPMARVIPVPRTVSDHDRCEEAWSKLVRLLPCSSSEHVRAPMVGGKAAAAIIRVAWEEQIDLIIFGVQDRWRLRHLV